MPPVGNRGWVSYWGIKRCFGVSDGSAQQQT